MVNTLRRLEMELERFLTQVRNGITVLQDEKGQPNSRTNDTLNPALMNPSELEQPLNTHPSEIQRIIRRPLPRAGHYFPAKYRSTSQDKHTGSLDLP